MGHRYYVQPLPPPGRVLLGSKQGQHVGRLVATRPGDAVILFDGLGGEQRASVLEIRGRDVLVDAGELLATPSCVGPRVALDMACAMPRKSRGDWLIEHGTELGVRSFQPVWTTHTRRRGSREAEWQRVMVRAAAQCGRAVLPLLKPAVTLAEFCALELPAERYVATFGPRELGPAQNREAVLMIGPEGGLTAAELEMLRAANFAARSLGPWTLRTETAALAGATRLLQEL